LYRAGKGEAADVVYAVAKWRDSTGRQCYRRLGRAWVEPDGSGGWRRRRGRLVDGYLDRRAAERGMDALIDDVERELASLRPNREATFADAGGRVARVGGAHEAVEAGLPAQLRRHAGPARAAAT
jgi:hypothetical protein